VLLQRCCYRQTSPGVYGELLTSDLSSSGSLLGAHPFYFSNKYIADDQTLRQICCYRSDNCDLYRLARPVDQCGQYINPNIGE